MRLNLELLGADHPGIVAEISRALAAAGIGIEELSTDVREAPMAGMLFEASAVLEAPPGTSMQDAPLEAGGRRRRADGRDQVVRPRADAAGGPMIARGRSGGVIELRSDNAAGVAPEILAAVQAANTGSALAYGGDDLTAHLQDVVRTVFEHPAARVFPVTSGTAANSLALSAATPPWGAVLCHSSAHIITAEGGATSLFGGGAVMQGVDGPSRADRAGAAASRTRLGQVG